MGLHHAPTRPQQQLTGARVQGSAESGRHRHFDDIAGVVHDDVGCDLNARGPSGIALGWSDFAGLQARPTRQGKESAEESPEDAFFYRSLRKLRRRGRCSATTGMQKATTTIAFFCISGEPERSASRTSLRRPRGSTSLSPSPVSPAVEPMYHIFPGRRNGPRVRA